MQAIQQTVDVSSESQTTYRRVEHDVNTGAEALKLENAVVAITSFRSALSRLTSQQPFYDHIVHNLLLSFSLRIDQALKLGDAATASATLQSALELKIGRQVENDEGFKQRFAGAFQQLGLVFFHHRRFEESIACFRKSTSVCVLPGSHINLSNALSVTGQPAVISDFTNDMKAQDFGRHIFIACVPKSASTFLKNVLVSLTGFQDAFPVYSSDQFEQDLYFPALQSMAKFDSVTQMHCRASEANVHLMQAFGIRPVVLVRNIFDSVMSLLDFYDHGAYFASFYRDGFPSLSEETKVDLIIDNLVPWYFQFVASWCEVDRRNRLEVYWLTYEDLRGDKPGSIQGVLNFYGLGAAVDAIAERVAETEGEGRKTRFNKGVAGRGETGLTERQKDRIRRFARYYPSTDFTCIGIAGTAR